MKMTLVATTLWLAAATVMSGSCGVARANDKPALDGYDPGALFAQLDTNKDGLLTADEIPDDKRRLFHRLLRIADKNSDGKLSPEEFAAGLKRREKSDAARPSQNSPSSNPEPRKSDGARPEGRGLELLFKRLDANGDGKVTIDEVPQERRERFARLIARGDKDGDKALTLEEFVAVVGKRRPGEGQPATPAGLPNGSYRPFGGLFAALDTDHDGKLSAEEIAGAPAVIRKLDKNGDGFVTPDEILHPPDGENRKGN